MRSARFVISAKIVDATDPSGRSRPVAAAAARHRPGTGAGRDGGRQGCSRTCADPMPGGCPLGRPALLPDRSARGHDHDSDVHRGVIRWIVPITSSFPQG
ncbi:hypothetical protein DLJ96_05635 [Actinotalea fermentans ATCC 43279 = JCM 9966 = DSM 3133]|nr:hypothetical protein DLJ96_05635 [Actinotalea fermentans ATCC 43279 = JCM 9966 = DSM 3133]